MSQFDFDLFVIGAGSGGVRCARMSAAMGAKVAVAEDRYYGGTCVNVGCVPKKLFVYSAHVADDIANAESLGWTLSGSAFDWQKLLSNKNREIARLNGIYRSLLDNAGVTVLDGHAKFVGPHELEVNGSRFTSRYILIASGGWPSVPDDIPGAEHGITSNEFFFLPALPDSALIVGGGYIAVEFAGILHNLGVATSLSYRRPLFLRGFDLDIRQHLQQLLSNKGIQLHFSHLVTELKKLPDGRIEVLDSEGNRNTYGMVLFATGRHPKTDNLGLEHTGVQRDGNGAVLVDEHYQTDEPGVYAIGDVIDRVQLTPVALAEGMVLARQLFGGGAQALDYQNIPTAVFSQPEIATVGLTEQQAREQGYEVLVFRSTFTPLKQSMADEKEKSLMKLVVDKVSDRVLGAHMVGPEAGEIIQGVAIAINMGATKAQFDRTIGIHPSSAEEFVTMRTPV